MNEQKSGGLTTGLIMGIGLVLAVIAAFAFGLVDINQTKETMMPEVKAEGGQLPAFDVKTADVKVGTETSSVTLPTINVDTTKQNIEIPTLSVNKPK